MMYKVLMPVLTEGREIIDPLSFDVDIIWLQDYRKIAHSTCKPECFNEPYLLGGFIEEVGEVAGKLKRVIRENFEFTKTDMLKELGDVLWYTVQMIWCKRDVMLMHGWFAIESKISVSKFPTDMTVLEKIKLCAFMEANGVNYYCGVKAASPVDILKTIHILAVQYGSSIREVALLNNKKLADRVKNDTLSGIGDDR